MNDTKTTSKPLEVRLVNSAKFGSSGEWLKLPSTVDELRTVFEHIGVSASTGLKYSVAEIRSSLEEVHKVLSPDDNLDTLNMLAHYLQDMEPWELDKLTAILAGGLVDVTDTNDLINLLDADNFAAFDYVIAKNIEELGKYWAKEAPDAIPDDMSATEYAALCVSEEEGIFSDLGYISKLRNFGERYNGIVPQEYRIVGPALDALSLAKSHTQDSKMEIKAVFSSLQEKPLTRNCVVEKIIRLSVEEYDEFTADMLKPQQFITGNLSLMRYDSDERSHVLLVTGEGRRDGILVDADGHPFAYDTSFVPNIDSILLLENNPAIAEFASDLERCVKYAEMLIHKAIKNAPRDEKVTIDLDELDSLSGINFDYNRLLLGAVLEKICQLSGIEEAELDDNEILIYRELEVPELSAENINKGQNPAELDAEALAEWRADVDANPAHWREDVHYRQHKDGVLYYLGDESGQYLRLTNDGALVAGRFERAVPDISSAWLVYSVYREIGSYDSAFALALQLGGERFSNDLFADSLKLAATVEARLAAVPVKEQSAYTSVLKTIEQSKAAPKPPRKAKGSTIRVKEATEL